MSLGYNYYMSNGTGKGLFYDCPLESVYLGRNISFDSAYNYGYSPFYNNRGNIELTIGEQVTEIGKYAFSYCSGLTSVVIPSRVRTIGSSAFSGCRGLTSVNFNAEKCSSMSSSVFSGCSSLTEINIGDNVTTIPSYAFYGCSELTSVVIPSSVTEIGSYAFSRCSGLTSVVIPSSVTSIGESAFYDVKKAFFLTNTKPSIGKDAFYNCKVYYTANNDLYSIPGTQKVYSLLSSMFDVDGVKYVPTSMSQRTCDMVDVDYTAESVNSAIGPTVKYTNSTGRQYDFKVNKVNMYAAYGCKVLSDLALKNEGEIEKYAFCNSSATAIDVDNTVTAIGDYAFNGLYSATAITTSNSGAIGKYAFSGCTSATTIVASNNGGIEKNAFSGCPSATTIKVSNKGDIGENAFNGCMTKSDGEIEVSNYGNIGESAFSGCSSATTIKVSNKGAIGENAFKGCMTKSDGEIEVSNDGNIGKSAFSGCTAAISITASNNGAIGSNAFRGCMRASKGVVNISNKGNIGSSAFSDCTNATKIDIMNEGSLGETAFYQCYSAKEINFGDAITSIGNDCFYGCSSVGNIIFSKNIASIGSGSFQNCTSMKSVEFNDKITSISSNAFTNCGLTSLTIPLNITSIASGAFDGCTSIGDLIFEDSETAIDLGCKFVSGRNIYFGRDFTYTLTSINHSSPFSSNEIIEKVTTNDNVTFIGSYAFDACTSINDVTLGDNILSLGECCFRNCTAIENIKLGEKTSTIGGYCFSGCSGLLGVDYNYELKNIGEYSFENCSKLASLTIHPNVDKLLEGTFDGCTSIEELTFEDTDDAINIACVFVSGKNLYLGRNVTYSMNNSSPFNGDPFLEKVVTSMNVTNIPDYLFYNCKKLKDVYLSDAVKTVGEYVFSGDVALTKFEVGVSIESIGDEAFSDCTALLDFSSHSILPAAVGTEALDDIDKLECTLHVPEGTEDDYMAADQWKEFWIEDDLLPRYKVIVTVDPECAGMGTVKGSNGYDKNTTATLEAVPAESYVFVEWSDGNKQNPRTMTVTEAVNLTAKFAYRYYIKTQPAANNISVALSEAVPGVEYKWYAELEGRVDKDITNDLQSTGSYAWRKSGGVWTSGNKGVNSSSSTLIIDITAKAGDKLTFDYSVSSEASWDKLTIYLGSSQIGSAYSGSASGKFEYTFESDMNTTLKFVYSKDVSTSSGSDQATISNVIFEGEGVEILLLDGETSSAVTASGLETEMYYYCEVIMPDGTILTSDKVQYTGTAGSTYTISIASSDNGMVLGAGTYVAGTTITIEAIAADGYEFVRWSDGNTDNPRVITVDADVNLTAEYKKATSTGISDIILSPAKEGIYDIMGRKLPIPQRGINIINGKKVIVR